MQHVVPDGDVPQRAETARNHLRLVEAALAKAARRKWYRDQSRPLLDDIARERHARHPLRHTVCHSFPPVVLERVHDIPSRSGSNPAVRSGRAHEWRDVRAPPARMSGDRMSAPGAAREWQLADESPAVAADDVALGGGEQPVANRTGKREKKIRGGFEDRPGERGYSLPVARLSAIHITSAGGSWPNHSLNAATPW